MKTDPLLHVSCQGKSGQAPAAGISISIIPLGLFVPMLCAVMAPFCSVLRLGVERQRSTPRFDIRFQVIVPKQMIGGTGVGDAGSSAYARALEIAPEAFLQRFGAPMPLRLFGDYVVKILSDPRYGGAIAFGLKGGTGITTLEEEVT